MGFSKTTVESYDGKRYSVSYDGKRYSVWGVHIERKRRDLKGCEGNVPLNECPMPTRLHFARCTFVIACGLSVELHETSCV